MEIHGASETEQSPDLVNTPAFMEVLIEIV